MLADRFLARRRRITQTGREYKSKTAGLGQIPCIIILSKLRFDHYIFYAHLSLLDWILVTHLEKKGSVAK
jgi:hypothetical protein